MKRLWAPIGVLLIGLLFLAGGVSALVVHNRTADAAEAGKARVVLWYPTGSTASCVLNRGIRTCDGTLIGNINDHGRVVARSVPLMADSADFRWTVSPDQVTARNQRELKAYLACVSAGRANCVEPAAEVPSWSSGMRVRWAAPFDGAYPMNVQPGGGAGGLVWPIVLMVLGGLFTVGGALWLVSETRHRST